MTGMGRALAALALAALAPAALAQAPLLAPPEGVGSVGLSHTAWQLVALQPAGAAARAAPPGRYTLFFGSDGVATLRLDCNRGTARYSEADGATAGGGGLAFSGLATTDMACPPPSLAEPLAAELPRVTAYRLEGDRLILVSAAGGRSTWVPGEGPPDMPPAE